jgi:hypothetical protein
MYKRTPANRAAVLLFSPHPNGKSNGAAMTERREQIAFDYHQPGTRHRNAQELPKVRIQPNRQAIQAEALRRAAYEAADPSYTGHQAGLHPDNRPFLSEELTNSRVGRRSPRTGASVSFDAEGDYEIEEDERYYNTRLPTSSRRYQAVPMQTRAGRVNVVEHYHEQPLRAHRQHYQQLPQQRERYTDDVEHIQPVHRRRIHPLVWIGVFGIFLILGWFGLNTITAWYQGVQNDWTYGRQRHFEINAVVGHGNAANNPSHFTAENNNGQIIVIELPGNNVSKAKIYQIETVPGNAGNPPVKISFQDMNGDGRLDMLVQIGDGSATLYVTLFNNGTEFVSKL